MKITIGKEFTFEAAHRLEGKTYGKCHNLHGHGYTLFVEVTGEVQEDGMICNFAELKKIIQKAIIEKYDHSNLNEKMEWVTTCENMASHFFTKLNLLFHDKHYFVSRVKLYETPTNYCEVTDV